ncbi:MAG TPA: hypothetical protein VM121_04690 [Acidimicrobiales bacterium]|nr:hypothetical protein [Acidimicrobiales bacterium]
MGSNPTPSAVEGERAGDRERAGSRHDRQDHDPRDVVDVGRAVGIAERDARRCDMHCCDPYDSGDSEKDRCVVGQRVAAEHEDEGRNCDHDGKRTDHVQLNVEGPALTGMVKIMNEGQGEQEHGDPCDHDHLFGTAAQTGRSRRLGAGGAARG